MTEALIESSKESPQESQRVERVLTDRLMIGNVTLRVLALSLWAVFAIIYWGVAP